jgi:hypothetical protein
MKRSFFLAAAAGAISISRPLLGRAEDLTRRVRIANVEGFASRKPLFAWDCGSAVVWLNDASGIYYYNGDRRYGRTKRGAYACEREAINAGNRASLDGKQPHLMRRRG